MKRLTRRAVLSGTAASLASQALAAYKEQVDCKLVFALDVSASVDTARWQVQRKGYAAACANPEIQRLMLSGDIGKIAVTVVQWSSNTEQKQVFPWMLIDSRESATKLSNNFFNMWRYYSYGGTCIGGGIAKSAHLAWTAPYEAPRTVIDVSGDGAELSSDRMIRHFGFVDVGTIRKEVLMQDPSLTVNGLVILGEPTVNYDLFRYYEDTVIGGPGAFAYTVDDATRVDVFADASKRKLARELVG